ncbi:MAG: hypothetical protein R6U28_00780 [Cyclonatronaceae bacterium]
MANNSRFSTWFSRLFSPSESETTYLHKGEMLVAFLIAYFIALSLWLLVNMSKDYTLTINAPIQITDYSEDMAFSSEPPEEAVIDVIGEGWNLLGLYRNPPSITISHTEEEVDLTEIVQRQFTSYPEISVQNVEPARLNLEMEPKRGKTVAVRPDLDIQLKPQHEITGRVEIWPDSVTVLGARSVVDTLRSLQTKTLRMQNVQDRVERLVGLNSPEGVTVQGVSDVTISFDVTEFTEGEVRIYVQARNVPDDREVRFDPSAITVRYNVPIDQFGTAQNIVPYQAHVDYANILRDTTGYVVPRIEPANDNLDVRLRSIQPRRIAYFLVVQD